MLVKTRDSQTKSRFMTEERFGNLCNRTHGCSQNCVNTIGSFVCVCFKGFEKDLTSPDSCSGKSSTLFSDWLAMSSNPVSFGIFRL